MKVSPDPDAPDDPEPVVRAESFGPDAEAFGPDAVGVESFGPDAAGVVSFGPDAVGVVSLGPDAVGGVPFGPDAAGGPLAPEALLAGPDAAVSLGPEAVGVSDGVSVSPVECPEPTPPNGCDCA